MRSRPDFWSAVLRTGMLAGLLAFANGGPSPVAVAQSAPPPLVPFRGLIDHVSATPNGWLPSSSAQSAPRSISGDGRYVVFDSNASDLIPNDFNWNPDVFLRDRQAGTTTRVSVADDGSEAMGGMSQGAAISANGRHVAFASGAGNLVSGDTNGVWDVFVRDLDRGRTVRVSVATGGAQTDADSSWPAISADGRFVAFLSGASTLVAGNTLYQPVQAYLHDRDADGNGLFDDPGGTATTLVSVSSTGGFADRYVEGLRVSADGRFVLFNSAAANLDPAGNPAYLTHLYRRDRQTGQTSVIDRTATGEGSNYGVYIRSADMSDDGRYVTYVSMSTDIEGLQGYGPAQVFRFDAAAEPGASTSVVSIRADGTAANGQSYATAISADGRYVAFTTPATNLAAPAPAPNATALVVRDMAEGTLTRADVIETGDAFDPGYVPPPAISADGTAVAFQSGAQNAVGGVYTWGASHVFVATAFAVSPISASFAMAGGSGSIDANATAVSRWSAASLDSWIVLTDGDGFGAGPRTIQYSVSANDAGVVRDGRIRVGSTIVPIHQDGDGDVTPPVITPIVTGTLGGDGWYVGTVTVQWTLTDAESPVVSQGYNCGVVTTIASDAISAPVTCDATSHGGTNTQTVVIRRDTTGPVITMFTPAPTLYTAGTTVTPAFTCSDANGYSGVASCAISEGSTPLSMTPGWHGFTVTATDRAGNLATKRVEYFASTGTCVPANVNLKALWRFENDATDQLTASSATPTPAGTLQFAPGIAGRSWQSQSTTYLDTHDGERLLATDVLTVAAWLKVNGQFGESATIVSKPAQYRIARYFDGTLRWAFNQDGVLAWVNTGVVIPGNVWTHVAVVYDHGLVKTYMNGRLAHAQQLTGTLTVGPNPSASMTIGGRADLVAFYFGWLDELQVATAALSATEIEAMALAGSGTLCPRGATTMTVSVPFSVGYGSPFTPTATLRNSAGLPLAGKLVTIKSYVSPTGSYVGEASGTTDSAGQIQVPVPMSPAATVRVYSPGVTAQFTGDGRDGPSTAMSNVLVLKGTPAITWPSPSSIVYGTALGAAQLAASANTSGTFTYTPGSGTVLAAGTRTLGVTFTPSDTDRWNAATATTALLVNKAAPVVTIGGGPFTFDGQGHPAAVTVLGVGGDPLSPYSVLYDGASDAPVQGGSHAVTASYSGDANYEAATGGGTLVINKATPIMSLVDVSLTYNGHPQGVAVKVAGVNNEALTPVAVTYNGSTTPPADTGTYTIDARYDGNGNYNAVSGTATLRILKAPAQLTWATPASIVYGTPVGPVQLNATANVPGTFSYAYGPTVFLVPGTHPLSVTFTPADAANYNGASAATTLTVTRAPLTITATSWTKPYGAPLPPFSVTASGFVYPDSLATLAGALSFATAATATSAVGTYPVTPQGVSSPNYAIAFVAGTLTVVPGMTATSLVASPNPSGLNQPVTLTATVSVMAGAGVPGGSVQFFDGGTLLGTAPLAGATAALTTNGFVPGSHTLSAAYSGDARFAGSAQGSSLTVRPGATSSTTSVTSSANPSSVGQSVALTANVVAPGTSTGSVAFYDGAVLLGTVAVSSNETARLTTSALAAGGHAITARYLGDASTTPSVSPAFAQYVRTSGNPRTSSVVVAAAPSPAALGALVTLTATVSGTQNQRPTGTVIFFVNGSVAGEGTLSPAGPVTARAVLSTSTLPHGSHRVDAVYLGDGTYRASTTAITVVVN